LGGLTINDFGTSVRTDSLFNVYSTGVFNGRIDFDYGPGQSFAQAIGNDCYVQKLDVGGNLVWGKSFGGSYGALATSKALGTSATLGIRLDASENVYILGAFYDTIDFNTGSGNDTLIHQGGLGTFLLKLDNSGNFIWAKKLVNVTPFGGIGPNPNRAFPNNLEIDNSGNLFISGSFFGTVDLDPGTGITNFTTQNQSGFIQKLDANGNFIWAKKTVNGGLMIDSFSNIILSGTFTDSIDFDPGSSTHMLSSDSNMSNSFVLKLDSSGSFVWAKKFGDAPVYSIATDSLGSIYLSGIFRDTVDFDPAVSTSYQYGTGNYNGYILKLDSSGNFQWVNISLISVGTIITNSPNGEIHSAAYALNNGDYGLLQKLDYSGTIIWTDSLPGFILPNEIHVDKKDNVYLTGEFYGLPDFDPDTGIVLIGLNSWVNSAFIAKFGDCTTSSDTTMISDCTSYTWIDGSTYYSDTTLIAAYPNTQGCDSSKVIILDITASDSVAQLIACDSLTWINGITYTSSNNTAFTSYTNSFGCSGNITLDLTILNTTASTDVQSVCDSLIWLDGITYTSSNNTATHIFTTAAGCDSLVSLNLTITNSSSFTDVISACDSYTWIDGNTYNANNNTATYTLTNTAGCDSNITLDLTINSSTTATDVITACDTYTWINGTTYTSNNNSATHTLTNSTGCDSVVTLDLTFIIVNITVNKQDLSLMASATNASYQWLDCANNYAIISGETSVAFNVTVSGEYAVEVTQNGCTDTSICYLFTNVGVNDIHVSEDIKVYPNPTSNYITIDLQKVTASKARVVIVDFAGQTIFQEKITKGQTPWTKQIDLSAFASGVYFVKVIIGEEEFTYQVSRL
jgi:hypothetical protein